MRDFLKRSLEKFPDESYKDFWEDFPKESLEYFFILGATSEGIFRLIPEETHSKFPERHTGGV